MGSGKGFLLAGVMLLPACSAGEDLTGDEMNNVQNTGGSGTAGVGGFPMNGMGGVYTPNAGGLQVTPGGGGVQVTPGAGGQQVTPGAGGQEVTPGAGGMDNMGGMTGMGGAVNPQGAGGMDTAGAGGSVVTPGSVEPIIPALTAQCPEFRDSTINFMGLGGIQVVAGAKPAGPTAPMVFYWHGTGSTAGEFAFMAGAVRQGVVSEGGVLISFQGTTGGDLRSGTSIFGQGDYALADQLAACAVQNHNVDPRRIFATGCSAGGLFSTAMAAERANYMAAAAPNSGGFTIPQQFQRADWTPALMTIHGAPGSDVVVIDFSQSSATADQAFKAHGGFVVNCNHGGGHCGGGGLAPDIWNFFKAHPYGTSPSPWAGGLPAGTNSACKIY